MGFFAMLSSSMAAAAVKPHILMVLADDLGWGNLGWHRPIPSKEVMTPNLDQLVAEGIELNRAYVYHMCSPTRSALQTGRYPMHVNVVNANPSIYNASESTGTGAGIPRNMTGMAAKLRQGGYATHFVGKWDAGMATPTHTPAGRGYDSSLSYFHHGNSYWNEQTGDSTCGVAVDLWDTHGPAHGLNGSTGHVDFYNLSHYEETVFMDRMLAVIAAHDPAKQPLFLMYSAHLVHDPLEVPQQYLDQFFVAGFDNRTENDNARMTYAAMTNFLDGQVGKLRAAYEAKGMWDDTLLLFVADNGGPIYGAGNNYPLRGGKYSEFEGGVRVAAFSSGGAVAAAARGTKAEGLMSVADIHSSFCAIAGVDPTDELGNAKGLPPVDGLDLSPMLLGTGPSPRTEVPLAPMKASDLQALDAYDAAAEDAPAAVPSAAMARSAVASGDLPCTKRQSWTYNDPNLTAVDGVIMNECCTVCNETPGCAVAVWQEWANLSHASHGNGTCYVKSSAKQPAEAHQIVSWLNGDVPVPTPPPTPPTPAPRPTPPTPPPSPRPPLAKCTKQQGIGYDDANLTSIASMLMNDCCTACNRTAGCAAAVWQPLPNETKAAHPNGTCYLKKGREHPILIDKGCAFTPEGVPVPPPVIDGQAGIVIGDMKLIVGISVNMAVFTGPTFPNASTPWTSNTSIAVPSFACSLPNKAGCLFNVSADPTEHNDLALDPMYSAELARLLARLREVSKTFFNPSRGNGDQQACAQVKANGNFFGPWLD